MKTTEGVGTAVPIYEDLLSRDRKWAMSQGSRYFEEKSAVQDALGRFARHLDNLGIPYAIAGGMALFQHGFRRFTEDVVILVSRDGLNAIHAHLESLGYVPLSTGSKNLRDTEYGVRIEFLIAGEFPGDGKPKAVAFPEPELARVMIACIYYMSLPKLVEFKLASGMTGGIQRMKDLTDVVELIKTLSISAEFADQLNPYVRDKYLELWQGIQDSPVGPAEI
ncbi:MAG TPA: hypothetical protein VHS97_02490 [Isosphaeraceae bacterium]|nr:hypothetical protein [Isosphaeraceae bacterium]